MPQRRDAAIVGVHEYPLRVPPGVKSLQSRRRPQQQLWQTLA